jgi:hypothetical protein
MVPIVDKSYHEYSQLCRFPVNHSESPDVAATLAQISTANRPAVNDIVAALLAAEKTAKNTKLAIPFAALAGTWRLRFASGARKTKRGLRLGKGYYWPSFVRAAIAFEPLTDVTGTITNQLYVGAIGLKLTGPCRYPGKKNILAFDFTQIQILVGDRSVYSGSIRGGKKGSPSSDVLPEAIGKLPFFVFLWASATEVAARGRSGGLAVWVKE